MSLMKLGKMSLILATTVFFHSANAVEFTLANAQLSQTGTPDYIKLPNCIKAEKIRFIAKQKLELQKALVTFKSGKDKHVLYFSTLQKNENTRWRHLGAESKHSCVESILIHGYAKQVKNATIEIKVTAS